MLNELQNRFKQEKFCSFIMLFFPSFAGTHFVFGQNRRNAMSANMVSGKRWKYRKSRNIESGEKEKETENVQNNIRGFVKTKQD